MKHKLMIVVIALFIFTFLLTCQSFLQNIKKGKSSYKLSTVTETPPEQIQIELSSALNTIELFKKSWKKSIKGDFIDMSTILPQSSSWENPLFSKANEFYETTKTFSDFVIDPSLLYINTKEVDINVYEIRYQLSFYYPMPWRPRIIIPGTATIKLSKDSKYVDSIKEKWTYTPIDLILNQFFPRGWDIWHFFGSQSPERTLQKVITKINNIKIIEIPEQVICEVEWRGLAKYSGPPLTVLPGFSLFGELVTSKPKRDPFYSIMPVHVKSSRYVDKESGLPMKQSVWQYPVPSRCHDIVINYTESSISKNIYYDDMGRDEFSDNNTSNEQEEASIKPDYVSGFDNMENSNILKRITKFAERGNDIEFDNNLLDEFAKYEMKSYKYTLSPKRFIASIDIKGEVNSEKLNKAINSIKTICKNNVINVDSKKFKLSDKVTNNNSVGLILNYVKACFNGKGEPAMAIYEMQYQFRVTTIYLDLELI